MQAERITGLDVRPIFTTNPENEVMYAAFDEGHEVIRRMESTHSHALGAIVETLYRRTSRRVFEQQGWMCFVCGQRKGLTADHIHPRARGRNDRRHNLRGVCAACHRKITDNKIVNPRPHPAVLESVEKHGWTWEPDSNKFGWHQLTTK